jgi:hypothetical protein
MAFFFTGKPGINVHLEDGNNRLGYFGLFITPKIAELMSRETDRYAHQILENRSELKIKSRFHN